MRWLVLAGLVVVVSCRSKSDRFAVDAAAQSDVETREASVSSRAPRFARPMAALRTGGAVVVAARDRATGALAFTKFDEAGNVEVPLSLPGGLDDPEIVGAWPAVGLLARATGDGGEGRKLVR